MRVIGPALILLSLACSAHAGELAGLLRDSMNHPQIRAGELTEAAARMRAEAVRARYYGSASMSMSWQRYEGPHVVGYYAPTTTPLPLLSNDMTHLGLNYILPLDIAGVLAAQAEGAANDVEQQELMVRQRTLLKLHQVTTAVVRLRTLESQQEAIAAARKRMASTRQRVGKEVELGRTPGITSRYVDSELARLGADEASLAGQVAQAQAELAEVTGREQFMPKEREVRVPPWQVAAETLPQRLAETELRGAQAQFEETRRALRPSLALGSGVGRGFAHGDHRDTWQVGLTLSMPLSASRSKETDSLALKAQAADLRREAVAREVQRQLAVLKAEYDAANSEAFGVESEVDYREQVNRVEHEMHKLGNQTLENTFQHERDLLDARYRLSKARARAVTAWSLAQTIAGESFEAYISQADGS